MYELTVMSIFRDSTAYIDRYISQLSSMWDLARDVHFIWVTGDNKDATLEQLDRAAEAMPDQVDVTLVELHTGGPYWPSADIPARWKQLESVWNETLAYYEPSEYAIALESELLWDWPVMAQILNNVQEGKDVDVMAPALWYQPIPGKFYDTHAFRTKVDGKEFNPFMPWYTDFDPLKAWIPCKSVGGMIVAKGDAMQAARWEDQCRLMFPEKYNVWAAMNQPIFHP